MNNPRGTVTPVYQFIVIVTLIYVEIFRISPVWYEKSNVRGKWKWTIGSVSMCVCLHQLHPRPEYPMMAGTCPEWSTPASGWVQSRASGLLNARTEKLCMIRNIGRRSMQFDIIRIQFRTTSQTDGLIHLTWPLVRPLGVY